MQSDSNHDNSPSSTPSGEQGDGSIASTNSPITNRTDDVTLHHHPVEADSYATLLGDSRNNLSTPGNQLRPTDVIKYFGDYEIIEEIARGGMGVVYKARQVSLNRVVALKMILSGQLAGVDDVKRFYVEAKAAANLDHPGIVPIYEIGNCSGQHFFSMKLIEGGSLTKKMGSLSADPKAAVRLLLKVVHAVHHAHQRGILHRDLKPANILLDEQDNPYVTDLGLAKRVDDNSDLTRTGAIVGTPNYMPPEQASGSKDISTTADIYSIGAILYELLTGKPPFASATPMETLLKVMTDAPIKPSSIKPSIDAGLELICLKCLNKEPSDRYASASELAADLDHWLAGEPISVQAPTSSAVLRLWMRQNFGNAPWIVFTGASIGLLLSILFWIATFQQDSREMIDFYSLWPRVPKPTMYFPVVLPEWLSMLCFPLLIVVLATMGLVIALIVRPKNQDADIIAGLVAGTSASLVLYLCYFAFQPDRQTIYEFGLLSSLGRHVDSTSSSIEEFKALYPDLNESSTSKKIGFLARKLTYESILNAPIRVWKNCFLAILCCLPSGLIETLIAGHFLRNSNSLSRGVLRSLEFAVTYCAIHFLVSMYLGFFFLWGSGGGVPRLRILLVIAFASFVLFLGFQAKRFWTRLPFHLGWILCLLFAVFLDFIPWRDLAQHSGQVAFWQSILVKQPDNEPIRIILMNGHRKFGRALLEGKSPSDAIVWFRKAEKLSDGLAEPLRTTSSQRIQYDISEAEWERGDNQQCFEIRRRLANQNAPAELVEGYFRTSMLLNRVEEAKAWMQNLPIRKTTDFLYYWRIAYGFSGLANDGTEFIGDHRAFTQLVSERVESERDFTDDRRTSLLAWIRSSQTWKISKPIPIEQSTADLLSSLLGQDESRRNILATWNEVTAGQGEYVDLKGIYGESPSSSVYATTTFDIAEDGNYVFIMGSDDSCRIWCNGQMIVNKPLKEPGVFLYSHYMPLKAGKNELVMNVAQVTRKWWFGACVYREGLVEALAKPVIKTELAP